MKYRVPNIEYRKILPASRFPLPADQGFSLIEMLVSMALLAIIAGIGISIFAIINNSYTRANAISKMQTQGQQAMEQLERSIRSASSVARVPNGQSGCTANYCLILTIPTASIEASLNGGCDITVYSWTAQSSTQGSESNGTIKRYSADADYSSCATGPASIDMFDTNTRQGVSVEQNGGADIFTVIDDDIDTVAISFKLTQGILLKPASGTDTRANVPLKTTASMRNY